MIAAVGGLKIPPVDRFIAGYYQGAKAAWPAVKVEHSYSQDFVDQAKCKDRRSTTSPNGASVVFQVAGSAASASCRRRRRGACGDRRRRRPVVPRHHVLTSATKKVDVAVFKTISNAPTARRNFKTNFNAIFTVRNGGVGYGKISTKAQPSWKKAVESVRMQIATGKIKVTAQAPPG